MLNDEYLYGQFFIDIIVMKVSIKALSDDKSNLHVQLLIIKLPSTRGLSRTGASPLPVNYNHSIFHLPAHLHVRLDLDYIVVRWRIKIHTLLQILLTHHAWLSPCRL